MTVLVLQTAGTASSAEGEPGECGGHACPLTATPPPARAAAPPGVGAGAGAGPGQLGVQLLLPPMGHVTAPGSPHPTGVAELSQDEQGLEGPVGRTREGGVTRPAQQEGTWKTQAWTPSPRVHQGGPGSPLLCAPHTSTVQPKALRTGHRGGTDRRETHPWTPDTCPGSPASRVCHHPPKLPPATLRAPGTLGPDWKEPPQRAGPTTAPAPTRTPRARTSPAAQHGGGATLQTEDHPLPPPVSAATPLLTRVGRPRGAWETQQGPAPRE